MANNNDGQIVLGLDIPKTVSQINSDIKKLQNQLEQVKATGALDTSATVKQINAQIASLQSQLKNIELKANINTSNAKKVGQQVGQTIANETQKEIDKLNQKVNKIQLSFANGDYEAKVESTIAKTQQWRDENGNARISTEQLRTALANLGTAYNNLNANGGDTIANQKALKQAESELSAEIKKVTNDVTKMNAEYAKSSKVESFHQKLTEFYDKNSATHKKWGNELKQMMDATASGAKVANSELLRMEQRYEQVVNEARQAGKLGLSFFDGIKEQAKKFTQWVSVTSVVMEGIRIGKDMIQDVRELDDSLLELTKVSDLSDEGLENVTNQAYKLGEKVARTGKEVIDATTEFKRAGFDMQQSMDMAESAMVMTNVAENITDTADAAGTLISVLKGFNMDASETMTIVDKINQVSNTSPIGFDNIAEGLERTAGTMAQSGNTIDQTIGLITAGYAQLRNVEKVSTGLITLSARLRGVDEEGETIDGLSAKLQEDFGKIGVAIENADGSLRSIYEIAQDYSKVLPTLSDKQKQYYAELAAGKRQVTVWNAITQQFQDAEYAVNQSINSQNSALDENQKKLDSIGGHVKSFESAMEHLSSTVVDSDLVKFFVDLGTTGVKAIDGLVNALSPLGTIGLGAGLLAGFKNVGIFRTIGTGDDTQVVNLLKAKKIAQDELNASLAEQASVLETDTLELRKLETAVANGATYEEAFASSIKNASTAAKEHAIQTKGASGSTDVFVSKQRSAQASLRATATASKTASVAMRALSMAMNMIVIGLITKGLELLGSAISNYIHRVEKANEKIEESRSSYEDAKSSIESMNDELKTTQDKIDDLQSKGTLSFTDKAELDNLKAQNDELERSISLEEKKKQNAASQTVNDIKQNKDTLSDDFEESIKNLSEYQEEYEHMKQVGIKGISDGTVTPENYEVTMTAMDKNMDLYEKHVLENIEKFEKYKEDIINKYNTDDVSQFNQSDRDLYNSIVSQLQEAYKTIYSDSDYNKFVIEPIFNQDKLKGLQDQLLQYFVNGGSIDTSALEEKFGADIITALRNACEKAGIDFD